MNLHQKRISKNMVFLLGAIAMASVSTMAKPRRAPEAEGYEAMAPRIYRGQRPLPGFQQNPEREGVMYFMRHANARRADQLMRVPHQQFLEELRRAILQRCA